MADKETVSEYFLALEKRANEAGLYIATEGRHYRATKGRHYKFFTKPTPFNKPALHRSIGFESADNFVVGWIFGRDFEKKMG